MLSSGECLSGSEIEELLKTPVLGVLPESYELHKSEFSGNRFPFRLLAKNLLSDKRKLYDPAKKYRGFFGRIKKAILRNL